MLTRYVLKRIGEAILVLFVLSVLVFATVRLLPGDPAAAFIDPSNPDPALRQEIYHRLGLDRPWYVQYVSWVVGALHGDFGRSLTQPYTVASQLVTRFPVSLELAVMATIIGILLGIPLGVASAVRRGRLLDNVGRVVTFFLLSAPPFLLAAIILLINSRTAKLRLIGYIAFADDPAGNLQRMLLPAFLLSLGLLALIARYTRGMLLETFGQDYIRTGRAKGVPGPTLVRRHALRNALAPVVTVVGVQLATLIGGTILMENVFALPGMGSLLINAINTSDYTTVQACVLIIGSLYVGISLIVDLVYPLIDPRIRMVRA